MPKKENLPDAKRARRIVALIAAVALVLLLFDAALFSARDAGRGELARSVTMDVLRTDGTEVFNVRTDAKLRAGDRAVLHVPLAKEAQMGQGSLLFTVTQAYVAVFDGETLLDRYGPEDVPVGQQFGAVARHVEIPADAWGRELTIVCDVLRGNAHVLGGEMAIVPTAESWRHYIAGEELLFFLYVALFVFCAAALVLCLFLKKTLLVRRGMALMAFSLAFILWSLGYHRMLALFTSSPFVGAGLEYLGLYFLPVPFLRYMLLTEANHHRRQVYRVSQRCFLGLLFAAVLLQVTGLGSMATLMLPLHLAIFGLALLVAWYKCHPVGRERVWDSIMRYGVLAVLGAAMLVLLDYYLFSWLGVDLLALSRFLGAWGLLVFVFSLAASYVAIFTEQHVTAREARALARMAYLDALTGLTNHAGCFRAAQKLRPDEAYAVLFFDLNGLKETNDLYGHAMGDRLLRSMARILKETFPGESVSRMGGDEYVVIARGDSVGDIPARRTRITERLTELSREPGMPATLSTSCGVSYNDPAAPRSFEEHVTRADTRMYAEKQLYKMKAYGGRRRSDRLFLRDDLPLPEDGTEDK